MYDVPEQRWFSPTLFSFFINNCVNIVGGVLIKVLMYADDLVIFADDPGELQSNMDALKTYCSNWELEVNLVQVKNNDFPKRKTKASH